MFSYIIVKHVYDLYISFSTAQGFGKIKTNKNAILSNNKYFQLIFSRFINSGGWNTMNKWLHESKEEDSVPFLMELLRVYQQLPVTIDLLKKNNTAKTVKQLSKTENERK